MLVVGAIVKAYDIGYFHYVSMKENAVSGLVLKLLMESYVYRKSEQHNVQNPTVFTEQCYA